MAAIRPYRADDLEALYAICLKTGDAGEDAGALYRDPKLLGHIYAGPYGRFAAESALVAEDDEGVGGYIVGPADTLAFEEKLDSVWWPALRSRYPDPAIVETPDDRMCRRIHRPWHTPVKIAREFPAHLHVNLLPRLRGRGLAKSMMDGWCAKVAAMGAKGAHLAVGMRNARAVRFYLAYGFREIAREGEVSTLGLPIQWEI